MEKSIQINVPASLAYNRWTQFAALPLFMEGVNKVVERDAKGLYSGTDISTQEEDFEVLITEQIPNYRIAWRNAAGASNTGIVTFHPIDDSTTQIILELSYEPDGVLEKAGAMLGFVSRRVEGDLQHFKDFIETQEKETGRWHDEDYGHPRNR